MRNYYLYKIKDKDTYILSANKKRRYNGSYTFRNFILGESVKGNLCMFRTISQLAERVEKCTKSMYRFIRHPDNEDEYRTYDDIELVITVQQPIEIYDYIRENFPEELI